MLGLVGSCFPLLSSVWIGFVSFHFDILRRVVLSLPQEFFLTPPVFLDCVVPYLQCF